MIEVEETMNLISALQEGAPISQLERVLDGPTMRRMFPVVGIGLARGLQYLGAVRHPGRREELDESGRLVVAYLDDLM